MYTACKGLFKLNGYTSGVFSVDLGVEWRKKNITTHRRIYFFEYVCLRVKIKTKQLFSEVKKVIFDLMNNTSLAINIFISVLTSFEVCPFTLNYIFFHSFGTKYHSFGRLNVQVPFKSTVHNEPFPLSVNVNEITLDADRQRTYSRELPLTFWHLYVNVCSTTDLPKFS